EDVGGWLREVLLPGEQGPGEPERLAHVLARRPGDQNRPRVHREFWEPEELRPDRPGDYEGETGHRRQVGPFRGRESSRRIAHGIPRRVRPRSGSRVLADRRASGRLDRGTVRPRDGLLASA